MIWPFNRRTARVKRTWFRDTDGTFFRNANLVSADMARVRRQRPWDFKLLDEMHDEWNRVFWAGVERKSQLGPDDIEVEPMPMREAYPQYPILWTLDEPRLADWIDFGYGHPRLTDAGRAVLAQADAKERT